MDDCGGAGIEAGVICAARADGRLANVTLRLVVTCASVLVSVLGGFDVVGKSDTWSWELFRAIPDLDEAEDEQEEEAEEEEEADDVGTDG